MGKIINANLAPNEMRPEWSDYFTVYDPKKESVERRHKKGHGVIQALEIPFWGKSIDLQQYFNE